MAHLSNTTVGRLIDHSDGARIWTVYFPADVEDANQRLPLAVQLLAPVLDEIELAALVGGRFSRVQSQLQQRSLLGGARFGHVDQVAFVGRDLETAKNIVGVNRAVCVELSQVPALFQSVVSPDLQTLAQLPVAGFGDDRFS